MLRSGRQYLDNLRDGRTIYIGSERVSDVTIHPAFEKAAQSFAAIYDLKMQSDHRDAMCFEEDGEWFSNWFLVPKTPDDLRRRAEAHRQVAQMSYGLLGRSMDHVPSYLSGMRMCSAIFDQNRSGFTDSFNRYFDYIRRNDLFLCYMILTPQGARADLRNGVVIDAQPMLEIVAEDENGIVVSGVKTLGTSAVFADEAWLGNILPLAESQKNQALTCAVKMNEPGVEIWVRSPAEPSGVPAIDSFFSSKFDESDAVLVLKNVRIPWDRVFVLDSPTLSRDIYFKTPAHSMGNHQAAIRFVEKIKLLAGIAHKAAEVNGTLEIPAVQQTLGRLAAAESTLSALIASQINEHEEMVPGFANVNRKYVYASMQWSTHNYYQVAETVRELLGAAPFQMPADASMLDDPAMRQTFERYWLTAGASAEERYLFTKMAWDFLGSAFGARQGHYERFYGGPAHMNEMYNFWSCDWPGRRAVVDDILDQMRPAISVERAAE